MAEVGDLVTGPETRGLLELGGDELGSLDEVEMEEVDHRPGDGGCSEHQERHDVDVDPPHENPPPWSRSPNAWPIVVVRSSSSPNAK